MANPVHENVAICNRGSKNLESEVLGLARVAKLADAPDLGSGGEILRGSSPLPGTFRHSRFGIRITARAILVRANVA